MRFARGDTIVRRFLHTDGRIAAAQTARVVTDDDRGLVLWIEAGSARMRRTDLDGTPTRALSVRIEVAMPTMLAPTGWGPRHSLILMPVDAGHSVSWSWHTDAAFAGWYVNLESPAVRWPGGVDTHDQALDLRIAPDGSSSWKDEDEFAARTGDPAFFDAETAVAIRAEGERVLAAAERRAFPFDGSWCDFRPDPGWSPTALPAWWDVPHPAGQPPQPARPSRGPNVRSASVSEAWDRTK